MATALNTIVLDLGTTAIKAAVCTDNLQFETIFSLPAPKISIDQGHYVSDAMAYLATVEQLIKKCQVHCLAKPSLGLCYQRSSFLLWNRDNGLPVTPLISWQDNRGISSCKELQAHISQIRKITGLPLTAYYFAPKVRVLFQQQPELMQGLLSNHLCIGTLDSFLIWHWTAGKKYLTDASMAARTQLMDMHTGKWSNVLSDMFKIPLQFLPEICSSTGLNLQLINGTTLVTSVADQSAALLASIEKNDSEVLVNLGTGGFVIRYTAELVDKNSTGYLNTLVYQNADKCIYRAVEGSLNSISAALKSYPFESCKIEHLAAIGDIYCIAEPSGIGAPYFRQDIGLEFSKATDELTKQQIACLLLEGIIFRVVLILEEFNQQAEIHKVLLSGGLSALPCIQLGIALCSPAPVFKLMQKHSGLIGVAILAKNLSAAYNRESELISATNEFHALEEKFLRWKVWFTQILSGKVNS
jgi:glycerol kinase